MNIKNLLILAICVTLSSCGLKRALTLPPKDGDAKSSEKTTAKAVTKAEPKKAEKNNESEKSDSQEKEIDESDIFSKKPAPATQPIWPSSTSNNGL